MSGTSGSGGVGALTIGGVATVVVIIGGVVLNQFGVFDPQEAAPVSVEQSAEAPTPAQLADAPTAASEKDQPTDQIEAGDSASLAAPEIDVIRFDPEGAGLIAGSAEPGARVLILLDGELIQEHTVGDSGEFVAFPIISPSETPRVLTFELAKGDARAVSDVSFILAPATSVANAAADAPVEEVASAPEGDAAATVTAAAEEPAAQQQVAAVTPESEPEPAPESAPVNAPAPATEPVDTTEVQIADAPVVEVQRDAIEADTAEAAERTAEVAAADAAEAALAQSQDTDDLADEDIALSQQQNAAEQAAPVEADLNLTQTLGQVASDTPKHAAANIAVVRSSETVPAQAPAIALEGQADAPRTVAEADHAPEVETEDPPKPAAVAVLKAGPDGIELVQPAGAGQPAPLNKIALDTISYSAAGEVVLAGRAQPDSLVRVYVDNTPWADIAAAPSGSWQGELEGLKPGVYTLRLDELDPLEGKVISRLETPFSRAEPEQLALSTEDVDPSRPSVRVVTVQEGDTLWAISQQRYGTGFLFVRLFEANRTAIRNPDLIYPGQVFTIPE